MDSLKAVQRHLMLQQRWVKLCCVAVLLVTLLALLLGTVSNDSAQIRATGMGAFTEEDVSKYNLRNHVHRIKDAGNRIAKSLWWWGDDDDEDYVVDLAEEEALAEDPISEAASWSEQNTWTAKDQAEVDALLPKGEGEWEEQQQWAPAEQAWIGDQTASEQPWQPEAGGAQEWQAEQAAEQSWQQEVGSAEERSSGQAAEQSWQQKANSAAEWPLEKAAEQQSWQQEAGSAEEWQVEQAAELESQAWEERADAAASSEWAPEANNEAWVPESTTGSAETWNAEPWTAETKPAWDEAAEWNKAAHQQGPYTDETADLQMDQEWTEEPSQAAKEDVHAWQAAAEAAQPEEENGWAAGEDALLAKPEASTDLAASVEAQEAQSKGAASADKDSAVARAPPLPRDKIWDTTPVWEPETENAWDDAPGLQQDATPEGLGEQQTTFKTLTNHLLRTQPSTPSQA